MKKLGAALVATLVLVGSVARAQGRPAVIVTDPNSQRFKVAVQRFAPGDSGADAVRFREELVTALEFSSLFQSLDPTAFLGPVATTGLDAHPPVVCSDWQAIDADALVEGQLGRPDPARPEVAVEFAVWDVAGCRNRLRKRYRGAPNDLPRIARRIADDIVEVFTGTRGVAGTEIAFVSNRSGNAEVQVMDVDGSNVRPVTQNRSINSFPSWSPDGNEIAYMSYQFRRSPHLFRLVRGGDSRPGRLLQGLDPDVAVYRGVFDPTGQGLAAVLSLDGSSEIFSVDADGRNPRRLTRNGAIDVSPTWSPDGKRIAFVSDRSGEPQLYLMDSDGGNQRRLTFDGGYNTAPAWSPDGRWIAYEARLDGQFDIWLIDPEGTVNFPLIDHPRSDEAPSWSPDGRKLAFHSNRRGKPDIYVIDVDGGQVRRLTQGKGDNTQPSWGPFPR